MNTPPVALAGIPPVAAGTTVQGTGRVVDSQGRMVEVQVQAQRNEARLQENTEGRGPDSTVQMQVSAQVGVGATGQLEMRNRGAGLDVNVQTGQSAQYQVQIPEADFNRIRNGQQPFPNPLDPATIPVGGQVTLRQDQFASAQMSATYRNIALDTGVTNQRGVGIGIQRMDPNTVRITAGPIDTVQNSFGIGLNAGPVRATVGNQTSLTNSQMRTVDINISTPEGRQAYQDFLRTGTVPASNPPHISNSGRVVTTDYQSAMNAQVAVGGRNGGVQLGGEIRSNEGQRITTTYDDGRRTEQLNLRYDRMSMTTVREFEAGATTPNVERTSIMMDRVHPASAGYMASAFEGRQVPTPAGNQDVQISFTQDQFRQFQDRVRQHVNNGGEYARQVRQNDPFLQGILNARTPSEMALAITRDVRGSGHAAERLLSIALDTSPRGSVVPLPGTFTMTSDQR